MLDSPGSCRLLVLLGASENDDGTEQYVGDLQSASDRLAMLVPRLHVLPAMSIFSPYLRSLGTW